MVFVRDKKIKGQHYAYLVENSWKKGKVKQVMKKYLGKIIFLDSKTDFVFPEIDFSQEVHNIFKQLISRELESKGFILEKRNDFVHPENGVVVKLNKKSSILRNGKSVVLFLNKRYVYPKLFDLLLNFYEPEIDGDKPGERLAFCLRDAGITIRPEEFVQLYKKIYVDGKEVDFVRKSDFDY